MQDLNRDGKIGLCSQPLKCCLHSANGHACSQGA